MKALIKTYRLMLLVIGLLIVNQVAYAQLCDITPNKYKACYGDVIEFSIITPPSSYYSIKWVFGDGDSTTQKTSIIQHLYDTFGCFTVTVTLYSDASGTIKCGPKSIQVCIYDIPKAAFRLPIPNTMCFDGNDFQFIDRSKAGRSGAPIVAWLWDFDDGGKSSQTNPRYAYKTSGNYQPFLQIADTNGCVDTASCVDSTSKASGITVLPDLAPRFKTTYTLTCPKTPVKFDNMSDSTGKSLIDWWWDFDDGTGDSSASNWDAPFTHWYRQDGAFDPTFYVKSWYGCVDSFVFPAGARNIYYEFNIKKSDTVCWAGNNICYSHKPRQNAYYWAWVFDDPNSGPFNVNDESWSPCHEYTAPGFYHLRLIIQEPYCPRDTTYCHFVALKGPAAMIKLPPPAPNSKCESGKKIPISVFEAAYSYCWNPTGAPVIYATPRKVAKFISRTDSIYCNAPIKSIDTTFKPGCPTPDSVITGINYNLTNAQAATDYYDSITWYLNLWYPGDAYPWVTDPVNAKTVYYRPNLACNYKNIHDSDQYKFDCRGPNLVFFPNNSTKYRLRYDIDNNAAGFSIPPGPDMSMDKCKNPSYPWASDSLQYWWDFTDSYGDDCTSTVAKPNVKCKYSTEITPLHLYKENGCYSPNLTVTDTVTGCVSQTNVTIPMEPPDAGWDYKVFKAMAQAGWDTSERKLDFNLQTQMPAAWGRRGFRLNGVPCVGQAYRQTVQFSETLPRCARQKWWVVFDSAADCGGYCANVIWADSLPKPGGDGIKEKYVIPDIVWADTNADGIKDKKIVTIAVQCSWIDDQTYAMMGNFYLYAKGGCKSVGVKIKTGDCIDTFWYNEYKYIADLQAAFDVLDPASYNVDSGRYLSTLDYAGKQHRKLCPPFQAIVVVRDTLQTAITSYDVIASKIFGAPWTNPNASLAASCKLVQSIAYEFCHKDSFIVDPLPPHDTIYTYFFMYPYPSLGCGVDQTGKVSIDSFLKWGFFIRDTIEFLDLRDTMLMNDSLGRSLYEPGKYVVNSSISNVYGCSSFATLEMFVGHLTDFFASDQIVCYEGGGDTVYFNGFVRYFQEKFNPWDLDYDTSQFFRWPLTTPPRNGNPPAAPSIPEVIEWDLNGDNVYGDGPTGLPDSAFFVYDKPGNYTVRMRTTDSMNCVQVLEKKDFIQVIGVVADFDTVTGVSVCAPQTVYFADRSYGLNVYQFIYDRFGNKIDSFAIDTVVSWKWNFGDGMGQRSISYLKNPIHTYRNNGTYTVSLSVVMGNGCVDTVVKQHYIRIIGPMPEFTVLDSVGCAPYTVYVKDMSDSVSNWEFVKGDATIASFKIRPFDSIFQITYTNPGVYKLYLRATDSVFNAAVGKYITCTAEYAELNDTLDPHFTIYVKPVIPSAFSGDTLICSGTNAVFIDECKPGYDTLIWGWDDGSSPEILPRGNATHPYTLPQGVYDKIYNVSLMATGDDSICVDNDKYWKLRVVNTVAAVGNPEGEDNKPKFTFTDRSAGGTYRKITIQGIDDFNNTYFREYIASDKYEPGKSGYKDDSIVNHDFQNDTGRFRVCEITWIERDGMQIGCPDTSCIEVNNNFEVKLKIPNIFTPGAVEGYNDVFEIKTMGVEKWEITIMNRWGEKVFTSTDPKEFWNGKRYNTGSDCAAGVYYFIINYKLRGKAEDSASGSVTLVR